MLHKQKGKPGYSKTTHECLRLGLDKARKTSLVFDGAMTERGIVNDSVLIG